MTTHARPNQSSGVSISGEPLPIPLIVGVMGGIGAGKSVVASLLARRGNGRLIVADALGHEALCDNEVRKGVIARFGEGIRDGRGEIDRRKLAGVVFKDKSALEYLESLTHPWIRARVESEIHRAHNESAPLVVLDAALLLEADWDRICHRLVFVDAPLQTRLERVARTRGWTAEDLHRRESAQLPLTSKHLRADHVVDNSSAQESLTAQVDDLLHRWGLPREPSLSDANPSVMHPVATTERTIEA